MTTREKKEQTWLEQIRQRIYVDSPFNLGTRRDADFGTGVNHVIENESVIRVFNAHDKLIDALKKAKDSIASLHDDNLCGGCEDCDTLTKLNTLLKEVS